MPLINKRNIKNADVSWPNPFLLKESEIVGAITGLPIEIVTLAIIEMIQQRPRLSNPLSELSKHGLKGSFSWYDTIDDEDDFWPRINERDLDVFYERYTPNKLIAKVKEVKNIDHKWGRKITI